MTVGDRATLGHGAPKKTIVFVSSHPPVHAANAVHGVFLRMRVILESIIAGGYHLRMLFLAPSGADCGPQECRRMERELLATWNIVGEVRLAPTRAAASSPTFMSHYVKPAFDAFAHADYYATTGEAQAAAVGDAIDASVAAVFMTQLDAMALRLKYPERFPGVKMLFDINDLEHRREMRSAQQIAGVAKKAFAMLYANALARAMRRAVMASDAVFVCSEIDRLYVERWTGRGNTHVLPNAIAIPGAAPVHDGIATLGFIGSYTYEPNVDAAQRLLTEIWPRVLGRLPNARLIIAGQRPERIPSYAKNIPGVEFTGHVGELKDFYARAQVVCCPIAIGSGTRIKIIEAAAYGRPIVSTSVGAEGLEFVNPAEILIADSMEEFAAQCIRALSDAHLRRTVGMAAREKCIHTYDRAAIACRFGPTLRSMVE